MDNQTKEQRIDDESWRQEESERLRQLFATAKMTAKRSGARFTMETFAEASGISSGNMVWQYLSGHRALNIAAASAFARGLGVSVGEFSQRLAGEIAAASEVTTKSVQQVGDEGFSLSLEKLVLINAISEAEAAILRRYRVSNETGMRIIENAAANAPKRTLSAVINDES